VQFVVSELIQVKFCVPFIQRLVSFNVQLPSHSLPSELTTNPVNFKFLGFSVKKVIPTPTNNRKINKELYNKFLFFGKFFIIIIKFLII
jgi:hypothetical protein